MTALDQFEFRILNWVITTIHNGFLDSLMPEISFLADGGWFWILLAILFIARKSTRKMGVTVALALLFGFLVTNVALKPWIARLRPYDVNTALQPLISPPSGFSFPSGHATSSFAAASAIYRNLKWA